MNTCLQFINNRKLATSWQIESIKSCSNVKSLNHVCYEDGASLQATKILNILSHILLKYFEYIEV